jgi:hypothetical protein
MERDEMFDEMLDECYHTVKIAGITFFASDILFECDPIAYRVALSDYKSARCDDGEHQNEEGEFCDWCGEKLEEEETD